MEVMGLMLGEFIDDYTAAQIAISFPLFIEWVQHLVGGTNTTPEKVADVWPRSGSWMSSQCLSQATV